MKTKLHPKHFPGDDAKAKRKKQDSNSKMGVEYSCILTGTGGCGEHICS